jgi:GNAT superfamily N-acetyltransferase
MQILELCGPELAPYLDRLGQLRITVFAEYPYLYEGSLDSEREYLSSYLTSPQSLVALVLHHEAVVGATTCLPMLDEQPAFQQPFIQARYDLASLCYFGESVLLPPYRGQGLSHEFFRRREAHARRLGAKHTTFCAVDRPQNHPSRPPDYRPLDALWQRQGYVKHPELKATFSWKEPHTPTETQKQLTFWLKELPTTP